MIILQVHNEYQLRGGEDRIFEEECELLRAHGQQVEVFKVSNDSIHGFHKALAAINVAYSRKYKQRLAEVLCQIKPDIVHVHNFFPLLTPSIYDACIECDVPVVQTLHNYRTVCPGALLLRDGRVCEDCLSASAYRAVRHRCYHDSYLGTLAVSRMVEIHRRNRTWQDKVDRFIALTRFSAAKFAEGGLPPARIVVKPNFTSVISIAVSVENRNGAIFVGRLSTEKGLRVLIDAWQQIEAPLIIVGDGPLLKDILGRTHNTHVRFLGSQDVNGVFKHMFEANFLVVPSICYETFGFVIIEAFACGIPVLVSRLGGLAEIIEDGFTGLLFEPGNPEDLRRKADWLVKHPDECRRMGLNARRVYEERYTPETNYKMLMQIYTEVLAVRGKL